MSKRLLILFVSAAVVSISLVAIGLSRSYASSQDPVAKAKQAVVVVFNAVKAGAYETATANSIDNRPGVTPQVRQQLLISGTHALISYQVMSATQVSDSRVVVLVKITQHGVGTFVSQTIAAIPVIASGDKWLLDFTHVQTLNLNHPVENLPQSLNRLTKAAANAH